MLWVVWLVFVGPLAQDFGMFVVLLCLVAILGVRGGLGVPAAPGAVAVNYMRSDGPYTFLIDEAQPLFSWDPPANLARGEELVGFQVVVTSGSGSVAWDSGMVSSNATSVQCGGSGLVGGKQYAVKVRVSTASGTSGYSDPLQFRVGLPHASDWSAKWVSCPQNGDVEATAPLNRLRATFSLPGVAREDVAEAVAYVTGAGYVKAFVNGQRVGGERLRLDPAWTAFNMRAMYASFDVLSAIQSSPDSVVLAAELGNGWADVLPNPFNGSESTALARGGVEAEMWASLQASQGKALPPIVDVDVLGGVVEAGRIGFLPKVAGLPQNASKRTLERFAPRVWREERGGSGGAGGSDSVWRLGWDRAGAIRRLLLQVSIRLVNGTTLDLVSSTPSSSALSFRTPSVVTHSHVAAPRRAGDLRVVEAQWKCGSGPRVDDSVYDGEVYDARLETPGWNMAGFDDGAWEDATAGLPFTTSIVLSAASVPLVEDLGPPEPATNVSNPKPGVWVFDFGYNAAGVTRLTLPKGTLAAGDTVHLQHAEVLMHPPYGPSDGTVFVGNLRSARATDNFTSSGAAVNYTASFTYHGFRYVQVTGLPSSFKPSSTTLQAIRLASRVQRASDLQASSAVIQGTYFNVWRGQLSNLMSLPSDCDQRDERKGWMGDAGLSAHTMFLNFLAAPVLVNSWALSLADDQANRAIKGGNTGAVGDTVPLTFGSLPGDPDWMTAYPTLLEQAATMLGDQQVVKTNFQRMQWYADFMHNTFLAQGAKNLYSQWCPPPAQEGGGQGPKPPKSFISTYAWLGDLERVVRFSEMVGNASAAQLWAGRRVAAANQFNAVYFDGATGVYGNADGDGLQTAQVCALSLAGVVPVNATDRVVQALVHDIEVTHGGKFATGITGMKHLHRQLTNHGFGNVAVDLLLQTDYPSFGFEMYNSLEPSVGALWELPDAPAEGNGMNSRNHHMFSSVGAFLLEDLGGVAQDEGSVGFERPTINPRVTDHPGLTSMRVWHQTPRGIIACSWLNTSQAVCAEAAENDIASLSCGTSGSVIESIKFASFGTPTGTCAGFQASTCNAANSTQVVEAMCLGKASCAVPASDTVFGDPCYGTRKRLYVSAVCSTPPHGPAPGAFFLNATVPAVHRATVAFPLGTHTAGNATITESGHTVFQNGKFTPTQGVFAAQHSPQQNRILFTVSNGQFQFEMQ